jgi:hypothetical protein
MKIAKVAKELNVPCFCSDLTVSPNLVSWNKNIAARSHPFPGLGTGLLEEFSLNQNNTGRCLIMVKSLK